MQRSPAILPDHFTTFGELLKYLRRRASLTQRELSIAVGYSDTQISRLEQNLRIPDRATLTAQFVPALHLEHAPEWTARLLELAAIARRDEASAPITNDSLTPLDNLPIQLTSFIGREQEMAEIKRLLAPRSRQGKGAGLPGEGRTRLITLTGSGGTGKTRLALQLAADRLASFPAGVWFVELASLADPALVPQTVATNIGLQEEASRSFLQTLIDFLRPQQTLLVLDNCEHLVAACAQLVEALLQICPHLYILTTSRETLGIAGEIAFPVPPLSTPDPRQPLPPEMLLHYEAVRLFVERAAAVLPGFSMTHENAPAIAQVCHRLDGVPLALELAAARVKALKVEQLAARLADVFRLLSGGSRTALPRHQTLRATIDWSYNLLSETERLLLRRLAVFAGGWNLEAAEFVCSGEGIESEAVLEVLTSLVNKSLVGLKREQGMEARYRLLETIRQYADEKLVESGEAERSHERHRDWFLALAERVEPELYRGRDQVAWSNRLEVEHDNLRVALDGLLKTDRVEVAMRLATALWLFWLDRNYLQEGRTWLEVGLAQRGRLSKALLARTLRIAGRLAVRQGDFDTAEVYGEESVALFRELDDKASLAWAVRGLGAIAEERGDLERAELYMTEDLALCRELDDKWGTAQALADLGFIAARLGDYERGIPMLEESLVVERGLEDAFGLAYTLLALGISWLLKGEADKAGPLLQESLTLCRQFNHKWFIIACLAGLAGVAGAHHQPGRAAKLWAISHQLDKTVGLTRMPVWVSYVQEPILAALRTQVEEAAFEEASTEGHALSFDQAIAYALDHTN
ncbi:MAG: tetratricopeptide repeat protein [Anaerolineae bacterium]